MRIQPHKPHRDYHRLTEEQFAFLDEYAERGIGSTYTARMFFRRFNQDITARSINARRAIQSEHDPETD